MKPPRPWRDVDFARLRDCAGVMTDIDDTLTRDGRIEQVALEALHELARASVPVVAITGRPIGWSEAVADAWPVAAVVAENGGVAMVRDPAGDSAVNPAGESVGDSVGAWARRYHQDDATREANARRLREVAARVLREVPYATLARDSDGRVTDIAVDHAEFATLDAALVERVVAIMRAEGMQASVSSIHINGWYGAHDKWTGACWIVRELWARRFDDEVARWVYVGDSANDQVMFRRFELSVGVANLMAVASRIDDGPHWLTDGERGAGFAEVAHAVVRHRGARG